MKKGLKLFFPDYKFKKITDIKTNIFAGSDLIVFDIDNTLFFPETTQTKKEIINWFLEVSSKYNCVCLSNSDTISKRKAEIEKILGCQVLLSRYKKPSKKLFEEIKEKYHFRNGKIIIVGDRILPDVLFGNLNNVATILVDPISNKENILVKISRITGNFLFYLSNLIYT